LNSARDRASVGTSAPRAARAGAAFLRASPANHGASALTRGGTRVARPGAMTQDNPTEKMIETLKKFDTLMVITDARNGAFHGRPMAVADVTDTGELWFVTSRDSEKVREVHAVGRSVITGQQTGSYVSLSGHIETVDDREKVRALWNEAWKVWFPDGKEDPQILLLRFRAETGEYWSTSGMGGIRYMFAAAKALLTGERPHSNDPEEHAKVRM
jgi:general stress protein 26